ncbi:MAG: hypothetical protein IJ963_04070 [Phascolarctobacterium sp.]|nr:hypothetical protein [Phascolarctobacterium sp.]
MNKEIPLLSATDVELRVAQIIQGKSGTFAILLVYKNARVDMRILDEVFGAMNWQRKHDVINDSLYCTVSIYDEEKKEWISKQDVGVPSNSEATKGEASDAFKRACFNWGIGRELYSAPDILIKLNEEEFYLDKNGKPKCKAKFYVADMSYDKEQNKFTTFLVVDKNGTERFTVNKSSKNTDTMVTAPKASESFEVPFTGGNVCNQCHATIKSQKVVDYAVSKYGVPICYDCQKKMNAA